MYKELSGLYSLSYRIDWKSGINKSICKNKRSRHDAPGKKCHCGFNAFFDIDQAIEYRQEWIERENILIGVVVGWGEARIHKDGWRAEMARVVAVLNEWDLPEIDLISKKYRAKSFYSKEDIKEYAEDISRD